MNLLSSKRATSLQSTLPSMKSCNGTARIKRVLLLDDDAATLRVTSLILSRAGFFVDAAADGEAGWQALGSGHYDLVVTDNDMPRLTGLQLVTRLRRAGRTLPVIVASGSLEIGEVEDYPHLALSAVFHKPFSFAELVSAARRVLEPSTAAVYEPIAFRP